MIKITEPYHNGAQEIVLPIGSREWQIGAGPLPLLAWLGDEDAQHVIDSLMPFQWRSDKARRSWNQIIGKSQAQSSANLSGAQQTPLGAHESHATGFQAPPLHHLWGERLNAILGHLSAFLEPLVREAETDPYIDAWSNKMHFLHGLHKPELSWSVCLVRRDPFVQRAWQERNEPTQWSESVTGRFYAKGGIPWSQIPSRHRAAIIQLPKGQVVYECDLVSAEPALACSILGLQAGGDVYLKLLERFGIRREMNRDAAKSLVMAALYGAGASLLSDLGVDDEGIQTVVQTRKDLEMAILNAFSDGEALRTWGGKRITPAPRERISHWIQGSISDISLRLFDRYQQILRGVKPFAFLHDGALWMGENPLKLSEEAPIVHTSFLTSSRGISHACKVRWKLLRAS